MSDVVKDGGSAAPQREPKCFEAQKDHPPIIATGEAIGIGVVTGIARFIASAADLADLAAGEVLLADGTRPEWEPAMARAGAIVTNQGGGSSHAALSARKLKIPAVVGTVDGASRVWSGARLIVSCAEGEVGLVCEDLAAPGIKPHSSSGRGAGA